jgi:D-glycero-D-manno-heptose 1,7-bisphosphate phosphatase
MTASNLNASTVGLPIDSEGVWCEVRSSSRGGDAALFLDRDGVVVEEVDYLCSAEDVVVVPGAVEVIHAANRKNIPIVLVTNQGGIGRGLYGWSEFLAVQNTICSLLESQGARLDAVYACPHHPKGKGDFLHPDHPARKPNPGMISRAAADLGLDLQRSWLVGDKTTDIEAAKRAGLAGALQVMTGYGGGEWQSSMTLATARFEVRSGNSIADAVMLPIFVKG